MSDVNDLLARLKTPQHGSATGPNRSTSFSGLQHPQPASSDRSTNLLNLLKFNQPSQSIQPLARAASASGTAQQSSAQAKPGNPQDALLKLLNRQESTAPSAPAKPSGNQPFSYVSPFDDLAATAPTTKSKQPSRTPTPLPDGRTQVEALLGIGAKKHTSETVGEALAEAGDQARDEASDAVARAEASVARANEQDPLAVEVAMREAAEDIKEELKDEDTRAAIEADMPTPMAQGFEDTIGRVASGEGLPDTWEKAHEDQSAEDPRFFSFPMKPFVALDVQGSAPPAPRVRDDIVMKVASMKREFDQIDRTLAAATTNHIVYAMNKGGGVRIIRQDDGSNKHIFKKGGAQIFNIGIGSSSGTSDTEPVLATGVNGSIYWTEVPTANPDAFADADLDNTSFQLPPMPSQEESNTSGAQLKTRAKLSSRHPEFFAIGRGKSIHIVWPKVALRPQYCDPTSRLVDSEKYFNERCLKIATGKAGKDFAFSQDDSMLVSLDKAGRLKFWDIKDHIDPALATSETPSTRQVEVKLPIMVMQTSQPDKSWATSVHFVDKDRPYSKGQALRYLLVGSKQNHTITLFDLALGKAVQELNFPHENETDPICSIAYHARSGVIAVGHPTRNSVYLVHLSAPKYNLSHMSQAQYVERLARNDKTLPPPQSTAIMSGMREMSLNGIGTLRSLEINGPVPAEGTTDERVLELYLMHSKGVTCLNLERQDIGIGADGKPANAVNAHEAKAIVARGFDSQPAATVPEVSEPSEASVTKQAASTIKSEPAPTPSKKANRGVKDPEQSAPAKAANGTTAAKATNAPSTVQEPASSFAAAVSRNDQKQPDPTQSSNLKPTLEPQQNKAPSAQETVSSKPPAAAAPDAITGGMQAMDTSQIGQLSQSISNAMSGLLSGIFTDVLGDQLEKLYRRIDDDKRVQEASGAAKQDAILRLVSSTLTDNVERSLSQIVQNAVQQSVVPALKTSVGQSVDKKVAETITSQIQSSLPKELKASLNPAVSRSMQDPEVLRIIADLVSSKISAHVEEVFAATLRQSIAPSFQNLAIESARSMTGEVEGRVRQQLQAFDVQHQNDSAKIDRLTAITTELLQTVRTMAGAQGELQSEVLKLRTELTQFQQQAASTSQAEPTIKREEQDPELESIGTLLRDGAYQEGLIRWLQSTRKDEIFNGMLAQVDPAFLQDCNQIVVLSVCPAVTGAMDMCVMERLQWLNTALGCLDAQSPDIDTHVQPTMARVTSELQSAYMTISEANPSDELLRHIHALVKRAKSIQSLAA